LGGSETSGGQNGVVKHGCRQLHRALQNQITWRFFWTQ